MNGPRPGVGAVEAGRDEGRIALLSLAFGLLALLLVLVLSSATAVHLQRQRLTALADAAARDAADEVDLRAYYTGTRAGPLPLDPAGVRRVAREHLSRASAVGAGLPDVAVDPATGSPDGTTAVVVLDARLHPPFADLLPGRFRAGIAARVDARAVAVLR
ncbi:pilus assembly protein TadG-related protein [Kineococcus gynurae]|uniref:Pilus assembly protein TadG-related protein n=1 Tax=Kineococcus gynurae TaxID=452979 RepID=A0ABV5LXB1_9ACTN